jgi:ferredoxin
MHIEVDRDVCIGAGNCVLTAPDVFDQDEDGLVKLIDPTPPDTAAALLERAERLCPSGAIRLAHAEER